VAICKANGKWKDSWQLAGQVTISKANGKWQAANQVQVARQVASVKASGNFQGQ
jgi:hypothetical protein